jgi:predicted ArsR family transcriptional regulator
MASTSVIEDLRNADVALERDGFCRTLIRELAGVLEEVVGLDEASGFISVVGQHIGSAIDSEYKRALKVSRLSKEQVAGVLVNLKARIQGDFYVIEEDATKLVLGNRACPFGDRVLQRESLCMMTSNVFGLIVAENLGYAKVVLDETIARGDPGCKVTVYFEQTAESEGRDGREYFRSGI